MNIGVHVSFPIRVIIFSGYRRHYTLNKSGFQTCFDSRIPFPTSCVKESEAELHPTYSASPPVKTIGPLKRRLLRAQGLTTFLFENRILISKLNYSHFDSP